MVTDVVVARTISAQGVNVNVQIVLPVGRSQHILCNGIMWSYRGDPGNNGRLTVDGGGFGIDIDIPTEGAGFIPFTMPVMANTAAAVTITLYAGGAAVVGKLNLLGHSMR